MLPAEQLEVGLFQVRVGHHDVGLVDRTIAHPDSAHATALHADLRHGRVGSELPAVRLDHLDQPGGQDLATASGVEAPALR